MKAIVLSETGNVEKLIYKEAGNPKIQADQVLVKNEYAGVNFIDTYHRSGVYPIQLPSVLGREGAGIITEVGAKTKDLHVGDRVAYIGDGAYAEYSAVSAKHVMKLSDSIDTKTGAAIILQGMTAAYLVYDSYPIKCGDYALVPAAAGGTGSLICQMIKAVGGIAIGLVSSEEKAQIALQNGAQHVINYIEKEDFSAEVMKITDGKGVQVVYDGVGEAVYKKCLDCLAKRGFYINFGNASGKISAFNLFDLTSKCLAVMRPALFSYIETREEFIQLANKMVDLLDSGKIKVNIHKVYDLENIAQAHKDLEGRHTTGKLVLKIS